MVLLCVAEVWKLSLTFDVRILSGKTKGIPNLFFLCVCVILCSTFCTSNRMVRVPYTFTCCDVAPVEFYKYSLLAYVCLRVVETACSRFILVTTRMVCCLSDMFSPFLSKLSSQSYLKYPMREMLMNYFSAPYEKFISLMFYFYINHLCERWSYHWFEIIFACNWWHQKACITIFTISFFT